MHYTLIFIICQQKSENSAKIHRLHEKSFCVESFILRVVLSFEIFIFLVSENADVVGEKYAKEVKYPYQ